MLSDQIDQNLKDKVDKSNEGSKHPSRILLDVLNLIPLKAVLLLVVKKNF